MKIAGAMRAVIGDAHTENVAMAVSVSIGIATATGMIATETTPVTTTVTTIVTTTGRMNANESISTDTDRLSQIKMRRSTSSCRSMVRRLWTT